MYVYMNECKEKNISICMYVCNTHTQDSCTSQRSTKTRKSSWSSTARARRRWTTTPTKSRTARGKTAKNASRTTAWTSRCWSAKMTPRSSCSASPGRSSRSPMRTAYHSGRARTTCCYMLVDVCMYVCVYIYISTDDLTVMKTRIFVCMYKAHLHKSSLVCKIISYSHFVCVQYVLWMYVFIHCIYV